MLSYFRDFKHVMSTLAQRESFTGPAHNWNEFAVVGLNGGWTKKSFDSETENVVKPLKSWENIYVIL